MSVSNREMDFGFFKVLVALSRFERMKKLFSVLILFFCLTRLATASELLISVGVYKKLSASQKKSYLQSVRSHVVELEQSMAKNIKIVDLENQVDKKQFLINFLITQSWASDGFCMVGGIKQPKVGNSCSTRNNSCKEEFDIEDSFQCGGIFGDVCISRLRVETISKRCLEKASKSKLPSAESWGEIKTEQERSFNEVCPASGNRSVGCRLFNSQMTQLNRTTASSVSAAAPLGGALATGDSAEALPTAPIAAAQPTPPSSASEPSVVAPVQTPTPPVAATPPTAPPAPATPATPPATEDPECSQVINFVIEGSSKKDGDTIVREKMLHVEASEFVGSISNSVKSETFWYDPTNEPQNSKCGIGQNPNMSLALNQKKVFEDLKKEIDKKSVDNTCDESLQKNTFNFMLGDRVDIEKKSESVFQTRFGEKLSPKKSGETCSEANTSFFSRFHAGSGSDSLKLATKAYLDRIKTLKNKCGDKANIKASLGVYAHGTNDLAGHACAFQINGTKKVTAREFYDQVYKPLRELNVETVVNLEPCYGGCLLENMIKFENEDKLKTSAKICIFSTSMGSRPSYGQDEIFGPTRSGYYNFYLNKLKNPLKANLCAATLDNWNVSSMAGIAKGGSARSINPQEKSNMFDDQRIIASFKKIGDTLGQSSDYNTLAKKCQSLMNAPEFPKPLPTQLTEAQRTFALQCLAKAGQTGRDPSGVNMSSILGVSDLVSDAANDRTPASVKTLERFAGKAKSELEACNQDWGVHAKFPIPKTIPASLPAEADTTSH